MPLAETPRFQLRLPPDLKAQLKAIAEQEDRTLTSLIIRVLRQFVRERTRDPD